MRKTEGARAFKVSQSPDFLWLKTREVNYRICVKPKILSKKE